MSKDLNNLIKYLSSQTEYQGFAWINHATKQQDNKIENLSECLTELERHEILHSRYGSDSNKEYLMSMNAKKELRNLADPYGYLLKKEKKEESDKRKMNFAQKYWWVVSLFGLVIGWSFDVAKDPVSKRLDKWLNPTQVVQATPKGIDSSETHKTDPLPIQPDTTGLTKPQN